MKTTLDFKTSKSQPLIFLPTFINEKGPFEFLLDTGANMSLLTKDLAQKISVEEIEQKEALGAAGKKIKASLGKVDSISVGNINENDIQIGILDELPKCIGHGVIGYNFLKNYILAIDYPKQKLILATTAIDQHENHQNPANMIFKIANPERPLIFVDAHVNQQDSFQFILDTGASHTVISPNLAMQMGIEGDNSAAAMGAGGAVQNSIANIASLSVGHVCVEKMMVLIADIFSGLGQAVGSEIDGILGYDFLNQFKLVIDFPQQLLRFESSEA